MTPTPMVSWTAQLPTIPETRMEREAELLNAIQALQGQVDGLKHDLES